jgi:4-amino-4-deoxy-L-arabinose transferase-like glycosyltransferase
LVQVYQSIVRFFQTRWQVTLITLALVIYLATRFVSLDSFPIYFFTDEAIQTNHAAELVQNHWQGEEKEVLPTYFVNGGQYNLGVSVYVQLLPYLIFGKSIWVTRGVSVLISLLAALAVGLAMRNIFKSNQPFLAILILSVTPAWFLHSRTAFETVEAVSFYAAFLYCYWMYRNGKVGYIYAAAVFAALSFYNYSPAQVVIAVTLLGVFFMDLRYHWKNRKSLLPLLGVAVLCLYPYIRFVINHPEENTRHLEILHSCWIQAIPFGEKIKTYLTQYVGCLTRFTGSLRNPVRLCAT